MEKNYRSRKYPYMNLFHYPIGKRFPEQVNVVVEISKDTNTKYEYDIENGLLILNRCLISSMRYPVNYGFIPQTIGDDGDPIDVLVYSAEPMQPGCIVKGCKIIGGLDMRDDGVKDYKLLAIPRWNTEGIEDLTDLPETFLKITRDFFKHYKNLLDKKVIAQNWFAAKRAHRIIKRGAVEYNNLHSVSL